MDRVGDRLLDSVISVVEDTKHKGGLSISLLGDRITVKQGTLTASELKSRDWKQIGVSQSGQIIFMKVASAAKATGLSKQEISEIKSFQALQDAAIQKLATGKGSSRIRDIVAKDSLGFYLKHHASLDGALIKNGIKIFEACTKKSADSSLTEENFNLLINKNTPISHMILAKFAKEFPIQFNAFLEKSENFLTAINSQNIEVLKLGNCS